MIENEFIPKEENSLMNNGEDEHFKKMHEAEIEISEDIIEKPVSLDSSLNDLSKEFKEFPEYNESNLEEGINFNHMNYFS